MKKFFKKGGEKIFFIMIGLIVLIVLVYLLFVYGPPSSTPSQHSSISPQTLNTRHQAFHYPHPEDLTEEVEPIPYLTLPFKKDDLVKNPLNKNELYDIYQGWIYSQKELDIHNSNPIHAGVDIHVPYGTQVISPVDGFAMSSYHSQWVREGEDYKETAKEEDKKPIRIYQGKEIRLGLGYFVYIYVPVVNRFLEFAHLSDIDPSIPFSSPTYNPKADSWDPENYKTSINIINISKSPYWVAVKKGDRLGKVGYSGLTWGYDEYVEGAKRPIVLDQSKFKSWDIPHVHLEEFYINQKTKQKGWQRDPYAIYDTYEHYPTETRKGVMGKDPLWILDKDNLPQFAK